MLDHEPIHETKASQASRSWWNYDAENYHQEHPEYLGTDSVTGEFFWCPEMLHEQDIHLLGGEVYLPESQAKVLEIGCGSAPCSRWLQAHSSAFITAFDLSEQMLQHATGGKNLVQGDATAMPFLADQFDVVFSVFGAIPFVVSSQTVMSEAARVLKPGGRFVFAVTHPLRWIFPDDPGPNGLIARNSYFDRSPYVERDFETQEITYLEQHRTLGDRLRELRAAGFELIDLIEPEWPADLDLTWGQWSKLRGQLFPGTAIFVAQLAS